jgi:hypothetical protein
MDVPSRERLKERHRFAEWAGRTSESKERRVGQLAFTGRELPGWALERAERPQGAEPPRLTSFWRRGTSDAVLRIDVFECGSVDAAHEYLIDALDEFQSSGMGRRTEAGFGDVAFGSDTVALFARGNVVVVVRNAGREVTSVTGVAQAIDTFVLSLSKGASATGDQVS